MISCVFFSFRELYKKYCEEVHTARLVFVSFLPDQHAPGKMATELRADGFDPLQFKFCAAKPDLTKLDKLFGLLSAKTGSFSDQLIALENDIKLHGMKALTREIKAKQVDKKDSA